LEMTDARISQARLSIRYPESQLQFGTAVTMHHFLCVAPLSPRLPLWVAWYVSDAPFPKRGCMQSCCRDRGTSQEYLLNVSGVCGPRGRSAADRAGQVNGPYHPSLMMPSPYAVVQAKTTQHNQQNNPCPFWSEVYAQPGGPARTLGRSSRLPGYVPDLPSESYK
jgi:hypothetical protein